MSKALAGKMVDSTTIVLFVGDDADAPSSTAIVVTQRDATELMEDNPIMAEEMKEQPDAADKEGPAFSDHAAVVVAELMEDNLLITLYNLSIKKLVLIYWTDLPIMSRMVDGSHLHMNISSAKVARPAIWNEFRSCTIWKIAVRLE